MKKTLLILISGAVLAVSTLAKPVEAQAFVNAYAIPERYVFADGWPKWIGRISTKYFTYDDLPEISEKYLPLALIKTGGFKQLVDEVQSTPNVDLTKWPSWIGNVRSQ